MTVSVIVPTVKGREEWLDVCLAAYEETCPGVELVVVRDRPTCGQAWIDGAALATGDYLHFTADDLVPFAGWWEAAVEVADGGGIPCPHVFGDVAVAWTRMACTCPFRWDFSPPNVLIPFFSRAVFERGGWLAPIHYGSDDWVTFLAAHRGIDMPVRPDYLFEHHAAEPGRLHDSRVTDLPVLCRLMAAEWFLPDAYLQMAVDHNPRFAAEMQAEMAA